MDASEKLPAKVKIGYAAGELSSALFYTVSTVLLMIFLTDNVGLSAALAGMALMIGKLWDAIVDPVIGYLSDRTRSRMGRRRPWLLFGAVPFGISFALMFRNPGLSSQGAVFVWALLSYMVLCTTYPCTNIPYNAILPELTRDFDERTSVNGYRTIFSVSGTLIGAGAAVPLIGLFSNKDAGYFGMSTVFAVLIVISFLPPFLTVKEPPLPVKVPGRNIFSSYGNALRNRPFVLILTAWMLNTIGVTVVLATIIYYFKYVYMNEKLITPVLVTFLASAVPVVPVMIRLSERIGKHITYIIGMSIAAVSVVVFSFVGGRVEIWATYAIMVFAGIGFSAHYVIPWSIVPDTVEYDYSKYGVRREGVFYALWIFVARIGSALAGLIVGGMLALFGYVPNLIPHPALSQLGIKLLVGPVAALFFISANIALWFYPIDRKRYGEIRAKISVMESRTGFVR